VERCSPFKNVEGDSVKDGGNHQPGQGVKKDVLAVLGQLEVHSGSVYQGVGRENKGNEKSVRKGKEKIAP
jgi:hypothetical protein